MAVEIPTLNELREAVRQVVREELAVLLPDVMTVAQAARHVGREEATVRDWIGKGLPVTRKGRRVHIRREDLAAWMAKGEKSADQVVASLRRHG